MTSAILSGAAQAPPFPCADLRVSVQASPTEAVLTWPRDAVVDHYFVQYSNGKFPTQITVPGVPGGSPVERIAVTLMGLRPGATYRVEICQAHAGGTCPGGPPPAACTTFVDVTAPRSYPGVLQPDPERAVCETEADTQLAGDSPGYPFDEAQPAQSAEACCQACAAVAPSLPYHDQCLYFVFDSRTRECLFKQSRTGQEGASGSVSGRVVAWPRPDTRPVTP